MLSIVLIILVAVGIVLWTEKTNAQSLTPIALPAFPGIGKGLNVSAEHVYTPETLLPILKDLGVKIVRLPLPLDWATANDTIPPNFAPWTQFVETLNAGGVEVLFITPFSLNGPGSEATVGRDQEKISQYCGQAAALWPTVLWEIGNEPNVQQGPNSPLSPQVYVGIANWTIDAIRAANPKASIIAAGMSGNGFTYIQECLNAGLRGVNAYAIHPYEDVGSTIETSLRSGYATLGTLLPIYVTEWGLSTAVVSEAYQASALATMRDAVARCGVPFFCWYDIQDGTNTSDSGDKFGLLRIDGTQKPSYAAFKGAS